MTYTLDEMVAEVRREIAVRKNVYPAWVRAADRTMTQELADYRIGVLEALVEHLAGPEPAPPEQEGMF